MAYTPDDPADLETAQLARYANRFPDKAVTSEDFLGKLARAEAQGQWAEQLRLQRVSQDSVPSSSSSYVALADWATAIGLSNGAGGYGPLVATAATGGQAQATGTNGSTIGSGVQLVGPDGVTLFQTTASATISGGVATINVNAITAGAAGNLAPPSVLTFISPPSGVNSTVTITTALVGGAKQESYPDSGKIMPSDGALLARIQNRMRNPPRTGTPANLRQVAEGSITAPDGTAVSGVARAYVYPRRSGTGTDDVFCTQAGSGTTRAAVPSDVLDAVRAQLALVTTTTEQVTVSVPTYTGGGCTIVLHVTPSSSYPFDWSAGMTTYTVAAYNGTAKTLQLSSAAPGSLVAGKRIQVRTSSVALPVIATVASISGGDTLHFDTLPTEWATNPPVLGDGVYPAGTFVTPIAEAVLAYIDGLGPSRASGFADPNDVWSDTADPFQLVQVAMDVTDDLGQRYLSTFASSPLINGSSVAVTATDNGTEPQYLVASSILVIP